MRRIRITLAAVTFTLITLLFLDFTGTLHAYLGWLAKIQFLPAVLALNVIVIVALVALTLIFGRIYCSVICPLGIMQDLLAKLRFKKNRFSYSPEKRWLRLAVLVVFIGLLVANMGSIAGILAPYSSFGRIAQTILQPAYIAVNNLLASAAESMESYAFYSREVWLRSLPTLIVAIVSLLFITITALIGGRTYCNTICPVGTVLGYLSKFSRLKIVVDADRCKNCRKCERNCKASCIDIKNHTVDYTRCVACGNCLNQCSFNAISYGHKPTIDKENQTASAAGRRQFLVGTGLALAGAALAQEKKKVDGGLAVIEDKLQPKRNTSIVPPGSISASNLAHHCTACQLCISECPNDVLRPSTELNSFMQPYMSYERGYCRPECNRCSEVCPTGAIKLITLADKSSTQIGHAVWVKKNCIPSEEQIPCGNCARHCPAGAIQIIHPNGDEDLPEIPAINTERCIGCGACENLCPARPFSAIYVEGHEVHKFV